jgi:hypothetical protein
MIARRPLTMLLLASGCLLFLACGCIFMGIRAAWPLLYKPSCDLRPILALRLPDHIETLADCPRNQMIVTDGLGKEGQRAPDDQKEFFSFRNGKGEFGFDVEYEFHVFFHEAAAVTWYESEKHWRSEDDPVFQEMSGESGIACVHYTKQERADPEGGGGPMGIYHARASFRLRNMFISITTNERTSKSDKLGLAVTELARMLTGALVSTNSLSH